MSKTLGFNIEHQVQTEWCWAAVSKSVSVFFNAGSPWTQCTIVNAELGRTDCCADGSSASCNCPWYLDKALQRVNNLKKLSDSATDTAAVRSEIDGGDPLGVRIGWNGGGGHFVALYGYDDSDPTNLLLMIGDPWTGTSIVPFDVFSTNYQGMGTWTDSYFTQP